MSRAAAVRGRAVGAFVGLLVGALALAGAAFAAKPAHGAHFSGHTSANPIVGFRAPVTFTVSSDGRALKGFSFGSFGCFGAGGFRPGVNPYTGSSIIHVGTVKVAATGRFSVAGAVASDSVDGQTTTTTITVNGRFTKPTLATGSITYNQKLTATFSSSCGPSTLTFTATDR